ncbi:MAG: TaqI family restriction endonuclease [Candidatus Cloacimonadaceae bacterium]|jgi:hypothetical protein|nr:TaqI family restriction endonuclease [Candidatus Cloacimonadota bacterium]MCB5257734.1 TaqI family restriction endonuclease [Candidatus Cloacimonadota bacterium]MDD5625044.1 TaqI family restriction endonuclease [Candidatus Cloacimonadota bacterium]MDY0111422.1 TaqI family restriction endonuclease [Candidatus Syntrophosphaera sp.]
MNKELILDLEKYRSFLETIPLDKYREELKGIKWVEQDLPRQLLPLASIFKYYWEERQFKNFDNWFDIFWLEINNNENSKEVLKAFMKYYFDKDDNGWFKKGFRARMYRTWISVLTQLDFCYAFEYQCTLNKKNLYLECNADLDAKGIDARVGNIEFQVEKISQRKEARSASKRKTLIKIPYAVFNVAEFERKIGSPRVNEKNKIGYQNSLKAFYKYFIRLNNGFIVFSDNYLKIIIDNINDIENMKKAIDQIYLELSGEVIVS